MWYGKTRNTAVWNPAIAYLCDADPVLARIIAQCGPCRLSPSRDPFVQLCKAIYSQQISEVVATILFTRFRDCFERRRPTPAAVREALVGGWTDEQIQQVGLSRQKKRYLIDLSEHFLSGEFSSRRLRNASDEEVIEALVQVNGIGRWTAEMFLIFVLNRGDVLPVDDLGLQSAVRDAYGLAERPKGPKLREMAAPWAPWRTIATWYLWRWVTLPKKPTAMVSTEERVLVVVDAPPAVQLNGRLSPPSGKGRRATVSPK